LPTVAIRVVSAQVGTQGKKHHAHPD
jgi:hypothetical protein